MPVDTRIVYCHTNNCTSRAECLYSQIKPTMPYFFGRGGNSEKCDDFVETISDNKPNEPN